MSLTLKRLSAALGAEIAGVDLRDPLDAATVAEIERAWLDHLVLVFRDQRIEEEDQIRFCRHLGGIETYDFDRSTPLTRNPREMLVISNLKGEDGRFLGTLSEGGLEMHADGLWHPAPPRGTSLYAIEVPAKGGETVFANLHAAYDTLADELKDALGGRTARFAYDVGSRPNSLNAEAPDVRSHEHPALARHPVTGRALINVNRMMTIALSGMDEAEAAALLERVYRHCERPEFLYEHRWRAGDLVLWDNRATLHGRRDFDPAERRLMKRVTITDSRAPVAA